MTERQKKFLQQETFSKMGKKDSSMRKLKKKGEDRKKEKMPVSSCIQERSLGLLCMVGGGATFIIFLSDVFSGDFRITPINLSFAIVGFLAVCYGAYLIYKNRGGVQDG